jgi:site-specific recombinase XerD
MKSVEVYIKKLTNKNYSKKTISTYVYYLELFLKSIKKNPYHITTNEIKDYLLNHSYTSVSHQNQVIGSLKLFAKYILNKSDLHLSKIERPKKDKKLPKVIESKFLKETILNVKNLKHKSLLMIGYSCALRRSEVINLKLKDIDSKRMLIYIVKAKGNKDRIVKLSQPLLETLREYFKAYKPVEYLFNGQFSNQYSESSYNNVVKKYLGKQYSTHSLRHSGATAMLENGTDLSIIQKILGHSSIKTTMIYTHVSQNLIQKVQAPI